MGTLVVAAPHDPVHPDELAAQLATRIPGTRLVSVPQKQIDPSEYQLAVQRLVATELGRPVGEID